MSEPAPNISQPCLLGAIADDYTGGADLAGMLCENGVRTVQIFGLQPEPFFRSLAGRYQAAVVCLKSRAIPAPDAVRVALTALERLQCLRPGQIQFKYCSTFDSTSEGNIGPVTESLLERLQVPFTIAVPALPVNGRTQYLGHMFVGDRLLSESHMRHHPANPMTDSNLVRHLQAQCRGAVGLISLETVRTGPIAIGREMQRLTENRISIALVDAICNEDLSAVAEAAVHLPLITGASGLGMSLPGVWQRLGMLGGSTLQAQPAATGPGGVVVLSGSCSAATLAQLGDLQGRGCPVIAMEVSRLRTPELEIERLYTEVLEALQRNGMAAVYSSAPPEARPNDDGLAARIETAFSCLAQRFVQEAGIRKLVVAGGETSGAVVESLGIPAVEVTGILDPGVPNLLSLGDPPVSLALKSGNFGALDFFIKAIRHLQQS
ncbi:MAG: 3-oxo-tetronate kinase [Bryobacteraceae bacterium]